MISQKDITEWRIYAPWLKDILVKKDLIQSKILIDLFNNEILSEKFALRGGLAINKLYLLSPSRYSEDINLVQIYPEPIGIIIDEIRRSLSWLGEPVRKQTKDKITLYYNKSLKFILDQGIKIVISIREHSSLKGLIKKKYKIENSWFSGEADIVTFTIEELLAIKLKDLYFKQRGRDLFDIYIISQKCNNIDKILVIQILKKYFIREVRKVSRFLYERNLVYKMRNLNFVSDISPLLPSNSKGYNYEIAYHHIIKHYISLLR
jgi:predicted nucleotidyltransferase component of viral defense system